MENKLLIICPSWEERSLLGFYKSCENYGFNHVIAVIKKSAIHPDTTGECIEKISEYCKKNRIVIDELPWNNSPIIDWNTIKKNVNDIPSETSVYIDITTMPRDIIWTLFFFVRQKFELFEILYYHPLSYNSDWLSREPVNPRLLLKHSGIMQLGKPTCTVIVTSFDLTRIEQLVTKFEPQKIVLCNTIGNQFDNQERNNPKKQIATCKSVGVADVSYEEIDAFNGDFGLKKINTILDSLSNYNVILASFGPKTTAISTYLAHISHPEIALCYVPCRQYNIEYSNGLGEGLRYQYVENNKPNKLNQL